jgi:hypothetical protein
MGRANPHRQAPSHWGQISAPCGCEDVGFFFGNNPHLRALKVPGLRSFVCPRNSSRKRSEGDLEMRKPIIGLAGSAALLCGSMVWAAHATPLTITGGPIPGEFSLIEKIGCERPGDNCPIGYRIERHGGGSWSCVPCWGKKKYGKGYGGSRYDREDYREDHRGGPPSGWRSYHERPYGWQSRGCAQFGPMWYCP